MMAIPMHVTLIPIFKMTTNMGLYDTLWSLIGPYVTFALPSFRSAAAIFLEKTVLRLSKNLSFFHMTKRQERSEQ